ncbi:MAG: LLM class flavin-dependent oxidoreductase [Rhodobacteraceae bacterium]|nr:LLM class flavin-dependent oxidoreductase [Paracoccaceae bacterium]
MTLFSCLLIGNESLLVGCGDALLERGHTIQAVVSQDRDILDWAAAKSLPVVRNIAALEGQFKGGDFDWLFSIANLELIPDSVLALPARGALNFHDAPLPRYAGLNAPVWALINGETRYGVTWHMLESGPESGIDTGDIVEQAMFDVSGDETAYSLNSKCYAAGMDSFTSVVTQLEGGAPKRHAQDMASRSYFARIARPEAAGRLDFTRSADHLAGLVRALDFGGYHNPLLCAKIEAGGRVVLVAKAEAITGPGANAPGTVLGCDAGSITVATGDGHLHLSGLSTPEGGLVDPTALTKIGQVLCVPDAAQTEQLNAGVKRMAKGEAHWRKALQNLNPVDLPLATQNDGKSADWTRVEITLPQGADGVSAVATIAAWALRSSGQEQGDLGFCNQAIASAAAELPGYVAPWVPLKTHQSDRFSDTVERFTQEIAKADKTAGYAADLITRDPKITGFRQPDVAVNLGNADPIVGSCITVAMTGTQTITLHFDRTRLDGAAITLLTNRLRHLMAALTQPETQRLTIGALPVLPDGERAQVLTTWNQTARAYDRTVTVHKAFETQAARTPDATALVFEDKELTYHALNQRANAVAAELVRLGVKPGVHVGLFVQRSTDMLVGALAILKAGGAYVPLDPAYPADRIAHYLNDSDAAVVITQSHIQDQLPASGARRLVIDAVTTTADANVDANVDGGAGPDDLAYLIYTSGSTGTPKGVMVEHRNVANFFAGMDDQIDHDQGSVWLAVTSLSFDISVLELFWTLARGFKVILSGDEVRAAVSNGPLPTSDRNIDFNLFYWGNDDGPGPQKYKLLLDGARFADANGFNAVWTPERHFHAFGGPYPNPSVTGAAVAAVTSNLSVRAGSCVAPLHHPARIAEEWAVIDNLTDGRAGLGIAAGWQPDDFLLRPQNTPPNNKPAMYEAIETLRKLWRGEAVEFPRENGEMHSVVTQPRPVSKELPIWVTTAGNPETWKEAGEIGANVLTHLLGQSIDEVGGKIKIYHAALREAGHDPADFKVSLMLHTYLADTREEAEQIAREPMKDYLRSAAGLIKQFAWVFPAFKRPKGVDNAFEMDLGTLGDDELEAILDFAFERYFQDSGMFGTINDALARTEQLKRIGVDEIACLIDYGIAPDLVMEGLKPLAEVLRRAKVPSEMARDDFSLAAQIIRHDVTHLQITPSMARIISMNDEARMALGRVQHLMLGGEALPGDLAGDLQSVTNAKVTNMYGPTETTIWSTTGIAKAGHGVVSIGAPIANTSVYILDAQGQPAPIGVTGELCIGGDGVTRGYWQRPGMTDERFPADPFVDGAKDARLYRTGDLARWETTGQITFLGRADQQVKIRGQRIELGEIEAQLTRFDGVSAAVAIARELTPGDMRLLAYVAAPEHLSEPALMAHLKANLPAAMVPAHVVRLDALPLTPNKKIDRAALPDPTQRRLAPAGPVAAVPGPGLEAGIAKIWTAILGVSGIRANDNFFELGGHSLLAVQAHRALREKLDLPGLSITDIFRFPTLGALAAHLGKGRDPGSNAPKAPDTTSPVRAETMSKRQAMRARRKASTG